MSSKLTESKSSSLSSCITHYAGFPTKTQFIAELTFSSKQTTPKNSNRLKWREGQANKAHTLKTVGDLFRDGRGEGRMAGEGALKRLRK